MNKKTVTKGDGSFASTCSSVISGVITVYLLIVLTVLPLIYDNSYFNILETKYKCFYMSTLFMLAVLLVSGLVMLGIDRKEFQGEHAKELFAKLKPQNWRKTFSAADMVVIAFWVFSLISTLQSEYVYESFWGNEGRYSGLFLITLYVAAYLVISHFWKPNGWVMQAFLAAGMIVCAIGITDYFQMDILHFRTHIKPEQSTVFTSTIGNINTYTAYVALVMGVAAAMFATAQGWFRMGGYYICTVVSFIAIVMGCSDNAYLALGALFAFLPLLLFQRKDGVVRYFVLLATFASVIQYIDYVNQKYAEVVIGLDSLFGVLVNIPKLHMIVVGLWGIALVLYFVVKWSNLKVKQRELLETEQWKLGKYLVRIWAAMLVLGVAGIAYMFIDANVMGHAERYGIIKKYLVFNDSWGTTRGYIWKKSVTLYNNFPIIHKIFGYGPDTFGIMTTKGFLAEMLDKTRVIFDSAHNEYLQYLLTVGISGGVAYAAFLVCCFKQMMEAYRIHEDRNRVYLSASLIAVLCYCFQAIVNINLPIVTPFLWLILGSGSAWRRKDRNV